MTKVTRTRTNAVRRRRTRAEARRRTGSGVLGGTLRRYGNRAAIEGTKAGS